MFRQSLLERPEDDREDEAGGEANGSADKRELATPGGHEFEKGRRGKRSGRNRSKHDEQQRDRDRHEVNGKSCAQRFLQLARMTALKEEHSIQEDPCRLRCPPH